MDNRLSSNKSEQGVALIVALLAILILSVLAASLIFTTQTQTWSAFNYRLATQSRYAAEAGVQRTMNWIINTYTAPTTFTSYDMTKNPVQCNDATNCTNNHQAIVLSAMSGVTANYPDSTVRSAYNTALSSQAIPGVPNATFSTYATLIRMTPGSAASWLGGGASGIPQTWQITSQGNFSGVSAATVQVVATYESIGKPIFLYGVAGDGTACPTVNFSGGIMNSWNSANGTYAATQQASGGNIGSNGNVTLTGGSTAIDGTIYSELNTTIGSSCTDGVTNGSGSTPTVNMLSSALSYAAPAAPSPMTPTTNLNINSNTCWSGSPAGCSVSSSATECGVGNTPCVILAPNSPPSASTNYGDITSNSRVHLSAGTYYINSLSLNGGSITLDSYPVVINLGGNGVSSGGTLFTSNSSTVINSGGIPANLQIVSACCLTGSPPVQMANPPVITMNSSSAMYAVVYAPNSYVHITGSSQFLGAVVSQKATSDSSGGFHYDLALQNSLLQVGSFGPVGFSWSKF
jgi:Tfp pilus assembly protein PilX